MFTIMLLCVARKNYVDISKVKVTFGVQRSKMAINELVQAITMSFIARFKIHLALLFNIIGHWTVCHAKEIRQYLQGQGHT